MCLVVIGSMVQNWGGLNWAWAIAAPSPSMMMQPKSWLSPTIVEKEARIVALSISSAMVTRRCHWISRVIGSRVVLIIQVSVGVWGRGFSVGSRSSAVGGACRGEICTP
jgi:hypothetical protein